MILKEFKMMVSKKQLVQGVFIASLLLAGVAAAQFSEPAQLSPNQEPPGDTVLTGAEGENKLGTFKVTGIATDPIAGGGKLCLGTSCKTDWTVSSAPPKCRLEFAQVTDQSPSINYNVGAFPGFSANLYTQSCDSMLSASSQNAGWVQTGKDYFSRVLSSDPQTPRICWFTRLVCDSGLTVSAPVKLGISNWPHGNDAYQFSTDSTNQCSDLINNDPPAWTVVDTPTPTPPIHGRSVAFSSNGDYLAVGTDTTPFVTIYKRAGPGSTTYNKLITNAPDVLPGTAGLAVNFSPDNNYLFVGNNVASNRLLIYKRSGDQFIKQVSPNGIIPTTAHPPNSVTGVTSYVDGSGNLYVAASHYSTPFLSIYKKPSGSDVFTKLANPATLPGNTGLGISFSGDGTYLASTNIPGLWGMGYNLNIYERSGDTFTYLTYPQGPDSYGGNEGRGVTFSNDGVYLALTTQSSPFVIVYKNIGGGQFQRLTGANGIQGTLASSGFGPSFSPDNKYLAVGDYAGAPGASLAVFERSGDVFTKMPASPSNVDNVYAASFLNDSQHVAIAESNGTVRSAILSIQGDMLIDYGYDPGCTSWNDNSE